MRITNETINEAKTLRHAAALKWGCATKDIDWPSCLGMAMRGETLASKAEQIKNHSMVASINYWPICDSKRMYINLKDADRNYRGDRNYQIYLDLHTNKIEEKMGKGTTTRKFDKAVKIFTGIFA